MKSSIMLLFIFLLFSSCGTDNPDNSVEETVEESIPENPEESTPENPTETTKIYLTEISSNVNSTTEESAFDFTDFDNLFLRNQSGQVYTWENNPIGTATKIEFQIESGKITKFTGTDVDEETQNSSIDETFVSYNENGQIIKIQSFLDDVKYHDYDVVYYESDIDFIDLIDDRDKKVTLDSNNNLKTFYQENIDFLMVFEYSNGNLIKKTLNGTNILSYTHDEKTNPFNTPTFLNFSQVLNYLNIIDGWESLFYDENNIFGNSNNIIQFIVENNSFGGLQNQSFTYEYNIEGFPVKKSNESDSITSEYSYTQK